MYSILPINSVALSCLHSVPPVSPSVVKAPKTQGLRPMTKNDVPVVHRLLLEYLSQFNLVPVMSPEEIEHWLLPQENIIDTYLVEVNNNIFQTKYDQRFSLCFQ